jgi:ligand-binding sensor domain-containing protein
LKTCFSYLFTLFSGILFSQQYNFHHYSVKDGVAQSQVYCLLQDSRGYLWMGTRGGGISGFDGVEFKNYSVKDSLVNNYVFCIKEDSKKNLWIGTNNGISHYNGIRFKNYQLAGDSAQVRVTEIEFDSKGRKWLATNVGVLFFDDKGFTNVSERVKEKASVISAMLVDKENTIWYGTVEGLFSIKEENGIFSRQRHGPFRKQVTSLKKDENGTLWVGTFAGGLHQYKDGNFTRVDEALELDKQNLIDIYFDNQGQIWVATTSSGVCQYNAGTKSFTWLSENEGLSTNNVRCILQDRCGNYWFGTSGGGVSNYFGKQFTHYDKSSGLQSSYIHGVFRDSQQRLWIGTGEKGVNVYDSAKYKSYNSSNGFADVRVKVFAEDSNGRVYLGTDIGLFTYDSSGFKAVDGLEKKFIRGIVKDKDGNFFVATLGTGLYKMNFVNGEIRLLHFTQKNGLLHDRLTCLNYDKQGRLWYGTETEGIGTIEGDKLSEKALTVKQGLPSNSIRCIVEDRSGNLWIGTAGNGLAMVPLYQGDLIVKKYDHTNGLTSSNIYLLACDNENNILSGSEKGLDHLFLDSERKIQSVKHYSKGEGFEGIETVQNSVFNDTDGSIWFGTINGLEKYNPANKFRNEQAPVTTITGVILIDKYLDQTEHKTSIGDWNIINTLNLPYDQNQLTFEFMGINFSNPDAVKYQWKLEGLQNEWSPVSQQNRINYSNLGPGDYTFMVKACNEDGVWNTVPTTLKFSIIPPVWMRWWFISGVASAVLLLVILIFKWRVNRIRAKAKEEQEKLQMEKDIMELEQKALRLQMNPHFIFNALNSIQSQIGTDNEQTARYYLAKFSRLMRQILDNSRNPVITLEEEVNTLENYLLIEKFCNGDRFDYRIKVEETIESDYVKIPPMILQPFVENAIKHGLKYIEGKRGLIEVNFVQKENVLECSVADNGIGRKRSEELNKISKETYHKSTALLVTQERLDKIKEDVEVQSLEIIDLHNEKEEAIGTRVIVRIPVG